MIQKLTLLESPGGARLLEVLPDLGDLDLGVVDRDVCTLREEVTDKRDSGSLTSVAGVRLESKSKDGEML